MNELNYSDLKLSTQKEVKKFTFKDKEVEVLQYLPLDDKYSLINVTLQAAKEQMIYNELLLDAYFHVYIVIMYTNIMFSDEDKAFGNLSKLYDEITSNGLLDLVLNNMNEKEYEMLSEKLNEQLNDILTYKNTIAGVIDNIIENLPVQAEEMQKIVEGFDPAKLQNVLEFAKSVNNGNLPTK